MNEDQKQQSARAILEAAAKEAAKLVPWIENEDGLNRCPHCCNEDFCEGIGTFDHEPNNAVSMDCGPFDAEDWKALLQCLYCGKLFVSIASNY
jgi:hypothetical protein